MPSLSISLRRFSHVLLERIVCHYYHRNDTRGVALFLLDACDTYIIFRKYAGILARTPVIESENLKLIPTYFISLCPLSVSTSFLNVTTTRRLIIICHALRDRNDVADDGARSWRPTGTLTVEEIVTTRFSIHEYRVIPHHHI